VDKESGGTASVWDLAAAERHLKLGTKRSLEEEEDSKGGEDPSLTNTNPRASHPCDGSTAKKGLLDRRIFPGEKRETTLRNVGRLHCRKTGCASHPPNELAGSGDNIKRRIRVRAVEGGRDENAYEDKSWFLNAHCRETLISEPGKLWERLLCQGLGGS